ncbi:MAG: hypothetical protein ACOCVP_04955 [Wenzhouxiangella sp.]
MQTLLRCIGALVFGTLAGTGQSQNLQCVDLSDVPASGNVRFAEDVLPIIEDELWQCTDCHGTGGGLALDQGTASHQALFCADTQSSVPQPPAKRVVPGAPLESWFYLRLACDDADDESFRMPRFGIPLARAELRVIYDWILQGAPSADTVFTSRFDARGFCR